MEKVREMNKHIFYNNLIMTIYEIMGIGNVDESKIRFRIFPFAAGSFCTAVRTELKKQRPIAFWEKYFEIVVKTPFL